MDLVTAFFDEDFFTSKATYTPSGGNSVDIVVLFDKTFTETNIGGLVVENNQVKAICKSEDVQNAAKGDVLIIYGLVLTERGYKLATENPGNLATEGIRFNVIQVQHDGTGITQLILSAD